MKQAAGFVANQAEKKVSEAAQRSDVLASPLPLSFLDGSPLPGDDKEKRKEKHFSKHRPKKESTMFSLEDRDGL